MLKDFKIFGGVVFGANLYLKKKTVLLAAVQQGGSFTPTLEVTEVLEGVRCSRFCSAEL